jgi:hypothetical protein
VGKIVEIDESKFGKRKYHRGARREGQWMFGGVEQGNVEHMFLEVVLDRTKETLIALILDILNLAPLLSQIVGQRMIQYG